MKITIYNRHTLSLVEFPKGMYYCVFCRHKNPLQSIWTWTRTEEEAHDLVDQFRDSLCTSCGEIKPDVRGRYSFGIYAGRLCEDCCWGYRDNCGIGQPQGDPKTLDEYPDNY